MRARHSSVRHINGRECALFDEPTDRCDLVITLQRAAAAVWALKGHLASAEAYLDVIAFGLLRGAAERMKQLDDFAPVEVVRGGMCKELRECSNILCHEESGSFGAKVARVSDDQRWVRAISTRDDSRYDNVIWRAESASSRCIGDCSSRCGGLHFEG